jgi:hypothetical protein
MSGISADQVRECVVKHVALSRIQRDIAIAETNKVHGTPTVFVNGRLPCLLTAPF